MLIPTLQEVLHSTTDDSYRHRNWAKHRNDPRYGDGGFPFAHDFQTLDSLPFTRQHVFDAFLESPHKGAIAAIKWGYPKGSRRRGSWQAFSEAFRNVEYGASINDLSRSTVPASVALKRLNALVSGVGTATTTKMMYFAGIRVTIGTGEHTTGLIYDQMVRRAIACSEEPAFGLLKCRLLRWKGDITPPYQVKTYEEYLRAVVATARRHKVREDQIELALFRIGRGLPERGKACAK